jgi:hypothetical protein
MSFEVRDRKYLCTLAVWGGLLLHGAAYGCGISWMLPQSHFNGVDDQGHVFYAEKIGEIDLGEDLKIPLYINFESDRETASPYLGKGFELSLLESRFVQLSETSFKMYQPDGWCTSFGRGSVDETVLNGSGGWKAEINGDYINAYAKCGWGIRFYKGHINLLTTPKGQKLEYIYSGDAISAINLNGKAVLTVERESTGKVKALLLNGKRMEITLGEKPAVQSVAGQYVVSRIEQSLKAIDPADGPSKSFEFAVNDKVQPTLRITSKEGIERLLTWDPTTKRIIADNDWQYQINGNPDSDADASIMRTNAVKQIEYWFYDGSQGKETTVQNGIKTVKSWFLSGTSAGCIRNILVSGQTNIPNNLYKAYYDDAGRLSREFRLNESNPEQSIVKTVKYGSDNTKSDISEISILYQQSKSKLLEYKWNAKTNTITIQN